MFEFWNCFTAEFLPGPVPLTLIVTVFVPMSSKFLEIAEATN
jgi:hypothetical protein